MTGFPPGKHALSIFYGQFLEMLQKKKMRSKGGHHDGNSGSRSRRSGGSAKPWGEVSNAAAAAGKRVRARKHSGASQNSWQSKLRPYLFIAPLVILSGVFIYYCIGFTVATSFTDWDGISSEMDFIGLKNYTKLLARLRVLDGLDE